MECSKCKSKDIQWITPYTANLDTGWFFCLNCGYIFRLHHVVHKRDKDKIKFDSKDI